MTRLAAVLLVAAALTAAGGRSAAGPSGEIVFASDRATANPGEVYSLALGSKPVDLTNTPESETGLSVAPRGHRIAFWSKRNGRWQLFVAQDTGRGATPVVSASGLDYPSATYFSPDGNHLLADVGSRLAVVRLAPRAVRLLGVPCAYLLGWSPDRRVITCQVRRSTVGYSATGRRLFTIAGGGLWSALGRLAVADSGRTAVVDERGRVTSRLPGSAVAWSPDGQLLALTSPGKLAVVDVRSGAAVRTMTGPRGWTSGVRFTPDGRWFAYTSPQGESRLTALRGVTSRPFPYSGVWSSTERSAFLKPIAPHDALVEIGDRFGMHARVVGKFDFDDHGESTLVWLPDGRRLLYEWSARSPADLWRVAPDGSGLRKLTATQESIGDPAWSRDGTRLAYASSGFAGGNAGWSAPKIVIASSDGRELSRIESGYEGYSPSWSPDGTRLVVANGFGGELDIVGADGRNRRQLVPVGFSPAWSPDGSTIAYCTTDSLRLIDPGGAHDRVLLATTGLDQPTSVGWSPDGSSLAYTNEYGLFVIPASAGGPARRVAAAREALHPSFSPDGASIAFTWRGDVYVVGTDGTGLHPLAPSPYADFGPAWRPSS
jgi:Tol biopolymer transport system component